MTQGPALHLAQDAQADALLSCDPFALLVGMLLDQQVPIEWAFAGPHRLLGRLGGERFDPGLVAAMDPEQFTELAARAPAVHRYPRSMATRIQALARHVVDRYSGDAAAIWTDAATGDELLARLRDLPGFGDQKAQIFLALLGKQLEVQPPGWQQAAGEYGERDARRSVADVVDPATLAQVRAVKQERKQERKERARAASPSSG